MIPTSGSVRQPTPKDRGGSTGSIGWAPTRVRNGRRQRRSATASIGLVARRRASTSSSASHITVEGLRLRVKMQGSGPPLLLVTGLGGNIEMWQPLVEKLTDFET